jgi:ABC-type bacteriocin/lantibiotic exporter with double-glycine peptidase domain
LAIALARLSIKADPDSIQAQIPPSTRGASLAQLRRAARKLGVEAEGIQVNRAALERSRTPAVAWWAGNHFVALLNIDRDKAEIHDPNKNHPERIPLDELLRQSGGVLLSLERQEMRPE